MYGLGWLIQNNFTQVITIMCRTTYNKSWFRLEAQKAVSWAGACVITDPPVSFVRGLSGGRSEGPALSPGNSTHHRALFHGAFPIFCGAQRSGTRGRALSSSALYEHTAETSPEEFASCCWRAKLMVRTLHALCTVCLAGRGSVR